MSANLLLLSSSTVHGSGYLEYARDAITEFLGSDRELLFAPFASRDYASYNAHVQKAFAAYDVVVTGLDTLADPRAALEEAKVLFVGGGNSFRLLKSLQTLGLMEVVRRRVQDGSLKYMAASAGTNMACPSLRTTNDMPIVQPVSFEALGFIPFQINPHYLDPAPNSTHMGETRETRIREFLEENAVAVLGIREGAWLRLKDGNLLLTGTNGARLFRRGEEPAEIAAGTDVSWLLDLKPQFDLAV